MYLSEDLDLQPTQVVICHCFHLTINITGTSCNDLEPLCLHGPVNYFALRPIVTDSTLGTLIPRRQESPVKPELLIPTMLPSGQFLKTRGDSPHANASLDPCRANDTWPLLYRTLRLLITPACLSLLRCEWGRSGGGSHRSVNTGIFDCCSGGSAKTLHGSKGGHLNEQRGWACTVNMEFWSGSL